VVPDVSILNANFSGNSLVVAYSLTGVCWRCLPLNNPKKPVSTNGLFLCRRFIDLDDFINKRESNHEFNHVNFLALVAIFGG
jgi:hypothetical protein